MSRKVQHLRHILRDGHNAEHELILHLKARRHIDLFVHKMRERMIGVHDLRREHRQDLLLEVFPYILLLLLLQLLEIQPAYTVRLQLFLNVRVSLIPLFI